MTVKSKAMPAVAIAILAAGGVVWVNENTTPGGSNTRENDDDRIVRLTATTSSSAIAVVVAHSKWRGTLLEKNESVQDRRIYEVWVRAGESVEFVILVAQKAPTIRQTAGCKIEDDGKKVDDNTRIVRAGDSAEIKCSYKTGG